MEAEAEEEEEAEVLAGRARSVVVGCLCDDASQRVAVGGGDGGEGARGPPRSRTGHERASRPRRDQAAPYRDRHTTILIKPSRRTIFGLALSGSFGTAETSWSGHMSQLRTRPPGSGG